MARFFRPRFSIRALAIFVTLICAYFGAWEFTKRNAKTREWATIYGDNDQPLFISGATVPMPFVVIRDEVQYRIPAKEQHRRRVYVWLFGPMFRLVDLPPAKPDPEAQRLHDLRLQGAAKRFSETSNVQRKKTPSQ